MNYLKDIMVHAILILSTNCDLYICRLYHSIWRLASVAELRMIITAYLIIMVVDGQDAIYGSTHAAFLLFYGIRALLLHDGRNKIFPTACSVLYK